MKKFGFKNLFVFLIGAIILMGTFFLLSNYGQNNFVIAGENFGGWSYDTFFGWTSESCNNLYGESYDDYCGLAIDATLDINFDGEDVNLDTNTIKDNVSNFKGDLINFNRIDIRNGGKNKNNGDVERNSNFNNSLYFDGSSYIKFEADDQLSYSGDDFSISLWFKPDLDISSDAFLFSNGSDINKRYYCWLDLDYYLSCFIGNRTIESNSPVEADRWHPLTITKDGNIFSMYLDNSLEDSVHVGLGGMSNDQELILGAFGNYTNNFKGELDEFRFFNQSLSIEQVLHNSKYNARYLLNIEDVSGKINGWIWSSGIGWICFGETCDGTDPVEGKAPTAKLYWASEGGDTYPHMITGWANAVALNDPGQDKYKNTGWMSLQSDIIIPANYDSYQDCVSCSFRDEENELVMYLKMDEDDGFLAMDSSGFNNDAKLMNFEESRWTAEGKVNNCLSFDGIDDSLEVSVLVNEELKIGLSDFSIEAWVKNEESEHLLSEHLSIVSGKSDQEWELYFNADTSRLVFNIFGQSVDGKVININDWSHVVVVGDRDGDLTMYVDDIEFGSNSIADSIDVSVENTSFFIGKNTATNFFWDDKIDIIRIYTRALSREEISYNYNFPEKRFCSACLTQTLDKAESGNVCYECERCELTKGVTDCDDCSSCRKYGLVLDTNTANIKGFAWGGNRVDDELVGLGWFQFSPSTGAGLYRSYVSSRYGDIYSKANVGSDYTVVPPLGYFNATYMIQANGHIMNWLSNSYETNEDWLMSSDSGNPLNYEYPKLENDYANVLGNLDYVGLTTGLYGKVIEELPDKGGVSYDICLGDNIYFLKKDATVKERLEGIAYRFQNCDQASGVIIVNGDLEINGDIKYGSKPFSGSSDKLASVAWIIKGDLKISPDVENLAGTFIVLGEDDVECGYDLENPIARCGAIFTCADGAPNDCGNQLKVSGQFLAKNFRFQRTFRSLESQLREAAEYIIYDGRNVINPPPGLGDVLKALPTWNQIAPY
jgi:Concanavalin A-like lectin/glucanases superfamily